MFHLSFLELEEIQLYQHQNGPPGAILIRKNVILATANNTGIANKILLKKIVNICDQSLSK